MNGWTTALALPPGLSDCHAFMISSEQWRVADLEERARAVGHLGDRQRVTDAKLFKAAKKKLGIESRREGFGRGAVWFWALPNASKTHMAEAAVALAPEPPPQVALLKTHSQPEPPRPAPLGSAPPIMDKKDKRASAKRNRRRGPKLGPDAARRSAPPANR